MKRRLSVHIENWMALIPFRISRHTWEDFPCVVCEIEQDDLIGRGESLGVYYLGDTEKAMLAQIDSIAEQLAAGRDMCPLPPEQCRQLAPDRTGRGWRSPRLSPAGACQCGAFRSAISKR